MRSIHAIIKIMPEGSQVKERNMNADPRAIIIVSLRKIQHFYDFPATFKFCCNSDCSMA